jgi:hypothetical protein
LGQTVRRAVSRYYFILRGGDIETDDPDGIVLPDDAAAQRKALAFARDQLAAAVLEGRLALHERIEVQDDRAEVLLASHSASLSVSPSSSSGSLQRLTQQKLRIEIIDFSEPIPILNVDRPSPNLAVCVSVRIANERPRQKTSRALPASVCLCNFGDYLTCDRCALGTTLERARTRIKPL